MNRIAKLGACLAVGALLVSACTGESEEKLIASAQSYLDKHDDKGAIIQLKTALQKNAKSAPARMMLARALRESGDAQGALVELRKAQELDVADEQWAPEMARTLLAVGDHAKVIGQFAKTELKDPKAVADLATSLATAYAAENNVEKALESSGRALQAQPGYAPAVIVQAELKAMDHDVDSALLLLDDVLGRSPGDERAGLLKADLLRYGRQDRQAALAAYRSVSAAHPEAVQPRASIVGMLFEEKKFDEAKVQLAELKKVAPQNAETLYLEARAALIDKDYKTTRDITAKMLKVLPNSARLLELAGAAEFGLKSDAQAESLLGRALAVAPGSLRARQLLAQTYLRSGQAAKAVEVLQPVVDSAQADGLTLSMAGEAYMQTGDTKRADEVFKRAAKASPTDPRVRTTVAMAQLLRGGPSDSTLTELQAVAADDKSPRGDLALISGRLRQNDFAGALKAVDVLQNKLPDSPMPPYLRGRILVLKKDKAGARAAFAASLAKDAKYFPATAGQAGLDLADGKPDDARLRFDGLLKLDPKNFRAYLALAELTNRAGGSPEEVRRLVGEAIKANPSEASPRLLLIENLLQSGDAKSALTAAQEATAALPSSLSLADALGRAQMATGDNQQALSTFTKLTNLQPGNASFQLRLAEASIAAKDDDGAARAFKRALEINPAIVNARRGLISLALRGNHPEQALTLARDLQKSQPKDAAGWALEGDIEATGKNWPAALAAYRTALQHAKSPETAIKLHQVLLASDKLADADRFAADWKRENPKDPAFRYYLGDVALARGDFAAAEGHYRAVTEIQPRNALALNNVAWLMVKLNKPGAVAVAEKANQIAPGRAPLLDTLATALAADNQVARALEVQKRAVQADPRNQGLRLNLAQLYLKAGDKEHARGELQDLAKLGDKFAAQAKVKELLQSAQ